MFAKLIDKIVSDFKKDPRNKVYIDEKTLLAAAIEETGEKIKIERLRQAINNYMNDAMEDDDYSIYDGAVYACQVAANDCFGDPAEQDDDEDYSVEYDVEWIVNDDGSFTAEVRPS